MDGPPTANTEDCWIKLWWRPGVGYTLQIPSGKILLLHSGVVHGGGVPNVARHTDKKKQFHSLHFYLMTQLQAASMSRTMLMRLGLLTHAFMLNTPSRDPPNWLITAGSFKVQCAVALTPLILELHVY